MPKGKAVLIYGRTLQIKAQKTQEHVCDPGCKKANHRYYHPFDASSEAEIFGMPDGSLVIRSNIGKPLWAMFGDE